MKEINPKESPRSTAYELWKNAPMPMVTFLKKIDVTNLVKYSKRNKVKFNMLMCYSIGMAASKIKEFFLLPEKDKLFEYNKLGINTIVVNKEGNINSCDIPFNDNLTTFNKNYTQLTQQVKESCNNYEIEDTMIIGTSALVQCDLEGVVNFYSGVYNNPFIIWGKYKKSWLKKYLTISFQFHHVQMDGIQANDFLNELQKVVNMIK